MMLQQQPARARSRRSVSGTVGNRPGSLPSGGNADNGLQRRPRVFSTALPSLAERSAENCTEARPAYNFPARTVPRVARMPKHLYSGAMFPASPPTTSPSTESKDDVGSTSIEAKTPRARHSQISIDVSPETDAFLDYVNNSLRLKNPPFLADFDENPPAEQHVRETSSSYGSGSNDLAKVQSPASPPPGNTLQESDISKYSLPTNRLSDLRSSTSGEQGETSTTNVVHAATISDWQAEPRLRSSCYNHCGLVNSQEILPSDSVSQVNNAAPPTPSPVKRVSKPHWFGRISNKPRPSFESCGGLKAQYDGGGDSRNLSRNLNSPVMGAATYPLSATTHFERTRKRKASESSLRSLSSQITNKAKKLKTLASSAIKQSNQHLHHVKQKWKQQNLEERKRYEAWKANRRKFRPADPLKGKKEAGFGVFSFDQSRHGHKGWWQEGVCQYQAPSWMVFDGKP